MRHLADSSFLCGAGLWTAGYALTADEHIEKGGQSLKVLCLGPATV